MKPLLSPQSRFTNRQLGRCRTPLPRRWPRLTLELLEDRSVPTAVAPPPGLISWWTADGTTADLMTRNNPNLTNGFVYAAGMVGQAFSFDGVDDRVQLADSDSLKLTASLSIEGWILLDTYPASGGVILFRGDDRGGLDPYSLSTIPDGRLQFQVSSLSGGVSVLTTVPLGQFIHVAATLDDVTGTMRIYVNGAPVVETVTTVRPFRDLDPASNPSIGIGNHGGYPTSPHNFPFDGLIDELAVYNRAITPEEIQGIYNAGSDGKIKMVVAKTSPDLGSIVSTPPTSFVVDFSFPIAPASLAESDFTVNGIAANAVTLNDADTATFTFASSPVTTQGIQTMHMDSGAVTRASDGLGLAVYDATFRYDSLPMQVTSTNPPIGGSLTIQSLSSAVTAVASMAGMDGGNGGWPVLYGPGAVSGSSLKLAIDEDNLFDTERSHTNEQVAFLALAGTSSGNAAPYLRSGTASVNSTSWTTITLDRTYTDMVVVVTPNYSNTSPPLVARVQPALGNSFQVKVDRVDGLTDPVSGVSIQYVVVEAGVYDLPGLKMEAVKFSSTVTDYGSRADGSTSWVGESRSYTNSYVSPVVLGQVMTANDPNFSVFWARGADRTAAPSSSTLYVGKHVGEDPNTMRANETIGYIVLEGGFGTMGGISYLAGVGGDTVLGMDDAPPNTYALTLATLDVNFNEPFAPASLGLDDLILSQGTVRNAAAVDADTATYTLVGVPQYTTLAVTITAGALTDVYGNAMLPFSAAYYHGTKFYVVNDGTPDRTYEYGVTGSAGQNYSLANTAPRGVASNPAGDRVWVVDANKTVYVYDTNGGLLGSWTPGSLPAKAQLEGIATNGIHIWLVDNKSDTFYKYTGAASLLSGSQNASETHGLIAGNTNPKGIVVAGGFLWVVNDAGQDKVFKYQVSGVPEGSWTLTGGGGSPTGITLDPSAPSHLWIVDNGTDRVYQYDNAVGRTSGSQAASFSFALAAGNTNPQDIADPPVPVPALLLASDTSSLTPSMPATVSATATPSSPESAVAAVPSLPSRDAVFATLLRDFLLVAPTPAADRALVLTGTFDEPAPIDRQDPLALVSRPGIASDPFGTDLPDISPAESERPASRVTDALFAASAEYALAQGWDDPWLAPSE